MLKERQHLAGDGVVTVAATVGWDGKLMTSPEVYLRGVVTTLPRETLQIKIQGGIENVLRDRWAEYARPLRDGAKIDVDWAGLQYQIERDVQRTLRREVQSSPLVMFLLQSPDKEGTVGEISASAATPVDALKVSAPVISKSVVSKSVAEPADETPSNSVAAIATPVVQRATRQRVSSRAGA